MSSLRSLVWIGVVFGCVGCGKLGAGCDPTPASRPATSDGLDDRFRRGGPEEDGRWTRIRSAKGSDDAELETQIRQLEALGYASGTKTAPSLSGVTVHDSGRASDGRNFYTSGHAAEAVLMRMDGQVVHRWARDFWDVFPNDAAERSQPGTHHWRRAQLLGNGDILALHEGLGLVKLDKDSNVTWAKRNGAQHDARELADGRVMLFDNGGARRGSAIQTFSVTSHELVDEYRGTAEHPFYSRTCGTAQPLPNGNTLITESDNGRAFEITADGAIVWEFYNPHRAGPQDEFIATLFRVDRVESKKGSDPF